MNRLKYLLYRYWWLIALIVGAVFLILLIVLRQTEQISSTEKYIYYVDNISHTHQLLIDRFNEKYRGKIQVIPVNLPFEKFTTNERKQLLAKSLRSKSDKIDVFAIDLIWGARFARWAEPLNGFFDIHERKNWIGSASEACFFDKTLIAAPFYIDIGLMYYRKDLIEHLPDSHDILQKIQNGITWDDFIQIGLQHPKLRPYYLYSAKNFEGLICSFMELLLAQHPDYFHRDTLRFDTPAAENALQLLVDLVHQYHLTPTEIGNFDEMQCYQYALEKDVPFFRGWPGITHHYKEVRHTEKLKYLAIASLPRWRNTKPMSVFGGWNLMVSRFSTKKREAVTFIKYLLEPENQRFLYENGGYLPVNKLLYSDSTFLDQNPEFMAYSQLLQHGIHRPFLVNYTKISDILSAYLRKAIIGELSVKDALRKASDDLSSQIFRLN
jgi:multiple sugar transport system substrate-binding protein